MKILYLPLIPPHLASPDGPHWNTIGDYQADTLFHGLRSLLGDEVIDGYRMWHMYQDADPEKLKHTWGKGFTIYGTLSPMEFDRDEAGFYDDLSRRIETKDFDYIICPIHHTLNGRFDDIYHAAITLLKVYEPNKVVMVDGWDRTEIDRRTASKIQYFKRELMDEDADVAKPISFSLPKQKIIDSSPEKSFDFAPLVPAYMSFDDPHQESYVYNDEKTYYEDYQKSHFAYTCKKGREEVVTESWDTMRHYEILANRCVPFFTDIEKCPKNSLFRFPKDLCIKAKKLRGVYPGTKESYNPEKDTFIGTSKYILPGEERGYINFDEFNLDEYNNLNEEFMEYTQAYLTTEAMAKYFIDEIGRYDT
ncbi:hypothetical protein CL634_08870 [bacterium]|nr:hypothetical protein [bacterium]|tara:strand:+ start:998 stop:2086 length:1089 start_codon:yes stop_codon:yes gene_type:complete